MLHSGILFPFAVSVSVRHLCVLGVALPALVGWNGSVRADETKEPPLTYTVKIGDKAVTLLEGEEGKIEGTLTNPKVAVEVAPHRVFSARGVTFKYPRSSTFVYEKTDMWYDTWTVNHSDFAIMLLVAPSPVTPQERAESIAVHFGRKNCTTTAIEKKLSGKTYAGKRVTAKFAGSEITYDILQLPSKGGVHRLIAFQDTIRDGQPSKEGVEVMKTIEETFGVE